ncbi:MAG: RluA family pseudouridine synthase [Clostridiales bacterium]|uniref:Pseudouridine synthase n=1 Tax=Candidatus Anaerobutyricum stercoripullorum TaxID=2838456 RepID=A0A9D2BDT2_9FIRM|nr:RluA family pseudouridine synthase [Clostridiales bacterium]HIX71609.1 RluA family pseudouridine synthase [Candidatus Anaerobutyricum stercoripullorum]
MEEKEQRYYYTVEKEQEGMRLDQFLAAELTEHSRSYIQKLIKNGRVSLNERPGKSAARIQTEDRILLTVPPLKELAVLPEEMPLDILYEDEDVILINKPKDMVVHPCPGRYSGTLVNGLLAHCKEQLSGINGVLRPGIVHRIDKDTTGVLVVCKNDMAHRSLAEQLKEHSITRKYEAIVYNNFSEDEGVIDAPIGRNPADRKKMAVEYKNGKRAVTHYRVLDHLNRQFNYVECQLETGRTHQIRVHMASIGHPLLGDEIYGPKNGRKGLKGQCLHARVLGFIHPRTGKYMEFEAPLPEYFKELLEKF